MAATAAATRTAPARRPPARRSAPVRRSAPARKPATRRATAAPGKRRRTGHTPSAGFVPVAAAAGAVGGIADSGLFVWLTRGRLWIGLLGTLLVGIVGLNVMALSFSASSSNAGQQADELKRQNSALRTAVASRLSNREIQDVAAKRGLIMPAPGAIGYLKFSPGDAAKAAQRLRDGELVAGVAAAPPALTSTATTTTPPVATAPATTTPATTDPAATATTDTSTVAPVAAPPADPATTATGTAGAAVAP